MVTWGHKLYGGDSSKVQDQLKEKVTNVQANDGAFAAVLKDPRRYANRFVCMHCACFRCGEGGWKASFLFVCVFVEGKGTQCQLCGEHQKEPYHFGDPSPFDSLFVAPIKVVNPKLTWFAVTVPRAELGRGFGLCEGCVW